MSNWYQQNQQVVFLDEWKKKGLLNICTVEKINAIEPIHIRVTNKEDFKGTRIIYAITAKMEDYLVNKEDSTIVEGKRDFTRWKLFGRSF